MGGKERPGNKVVHTTPAPLSVAEMRWWVGREKELGGFVGAGEGTARQSQSHGHAGEPRVAM